MSFDLPLTAFALESSGSPLPLGAAHTLTLSAAVDDVAGEPLPAGAMQPLRTSALHGEAPPPLTLTF